MRNTPNVKVNRYRIHQGTWGSTDADGNNGAFWIPQKDGPTLLVIAPDGEGWEHVSVSLADRCPTWSEMCLVKELFFRDDETVIQYHPPKSANISNHDFCLHLWRPTTIELPRPAGWMVGVDGITHQQAARMLPEKMLAVAREAYEKMQPHGGRDEG